MPALHATVYLKDVAAHSVGAMAILLGAELHLKQQSLDAIRGSVLGEDEEDDLSLVRFAGKDVDFKTVADELRTVSMWGDLRLIVVDDADEFVSKNRPHLETYLKSPAKKSVLVLLVKSWPKTTKLAKAAVKSCLVLECAELKGGALTQWMMETCRDQYQKKISRDAAALVVTMAGNNLGLLSQEVSKLVAYVGDRERVTPDDVRAVVGGWTTETAFAMIDAVVAGQLDRSLSLLNDLLRSGESPHRILGAISFSFRKLAVATEAARQGTGLSVALAQAGIFRNRVNDAERHLRRIGRQDAEKIYRHLLEADTELKGGARVSERVSLEKLLVRLIGAVSKRA